MFLAAPLSLGRKRVCHSVNLLMKDGGVSRAAPGFAKKWFLYNFLRNTSQNKGFLLTKLCQNIVTNQFCDQIFWHKIIKNKKTMQDIKMLLTVHLIGCWGVMFLLPKDCVKFFLLQNWNCQHKIFFCFVTIWVFEFYQNLIFWVVII